jgi:hypothetical protein
LYSFPHAPMESCCTQCTNIARRDATSKWMIFETFVASFREAKGKEPANTVLSRVTKRRDACRRRLLLKAESRRPEGAGGLKC